MSYDEPYNHEFDTDRYLDLQAALFQLQAGGYSRSLSDERYSFIGPDGARFAQVRADWIRQQRGDDPREGVALDIPGGCEWILFAWAAWYLGLRVVPIDPRWSAERKDLALVNCSVHITAEHLEQLVIFSSSGVSPAQPPLLDAISRDRYLPALELQTSGSIGLPKRIIHTRSSIMAQGLLGAKALDLTWKDEWLAPVPAAHAAGVGAFLRAFAAGAGTTLLPGFDLELVLRALMTPEENYWASHPVSVVSLVPTTLSRLLDAGLANPPHLKAAVIGGGPLSEELKERAIEAGVPVRASWGMTETLGMICVARDADDKGVGRPIPGVEVIANEEGELLVRGPIVAPGLADDQGWFHTGDAGHLDEAGFVHVVGRMGSMIISGGENVFPEAVERALLSSGLVTDAFVTGEADSEWGQRVIASVVTGDPGTAAEEIKASISRLLSPWEVPKEIRLVSEINRNELGKVERRSDG